MPPAFDTRHIGELLTAILSVCPGEALAGQNHAGRAVGDLPAVEFAHPAFDGGVESGVVAKAALGKGPVSCLCPRVLFGVAKIDFCDAGQRLVSDSVAVVIFLGNAIEQERLREFAACGFMSLPRRGSQILGSGSAIDIAHQLQAHHAGHVIVPRLNVAHGRQQRH